MCLWSNRGALIAKLFPDLAAALPATARAARWRSCGGAFRSRCTTLLPEPSSIGHGLNPALDSPAVAPKSSVVTPTPRSFRTSGWREVLEFGPREEVGTSVYESLN